jgi:hypothetical protein
MFEEIRTPTPDEYGFFCHPDVPGEEESDDVRALCNALGFDAAAVDMESDAPELSDSWHENDDMTAPTRWTPTPPAGYGWILVAKYDTEDGPGAMFVRPTSTDACQKCGKPWIEHDFGVPEPTC